VTDHSGTGTSAYYVTYDANGNVSEYIDSGRNIVAHYEYSPFGKLTATDGSMAAEFNHRFSTKILDTESGTYYYGFRYYSPELGRWLSRDPMGESGGINLYLMVRNSITNTYDVLGKVAAPPGSGTTTVPSDADMKAALVAFALTRWQQGLCCATKIDYVPRGSTSRYRPVDAKPYQVYAKHTFQLSGAPTGYDYRVCKIEQAVYTVLEFNVSGQPPYVALHTPDPGVGPGVKPDGRAPLSAFDIWLQRTTAPFKVKTFAIVYITNSSAVGPLIGNPVFSGQPHDVHKVTGNTPDYPNAGDAGVVNVGAW